MRAGRNAAAPPLPPRTAQKTGLNGTRTCPRSAVSIDCELMWDRNKSMVVSDLEACIMRAQATSFQHGRGMQYGGPHYANREILVHEGDVKRVTADTLALATELMLSPVSLQNFAPGGEGSKWFGVRTLQNPADAAVMANVIWELKPGLVIEIGTECGGSATFIGQLLRLNGRGKVVTYDMLPINRRQCKPPRGFDSPVWAALVRDGLVESRVADVTSAREIAYLRSQARATPHAVVVIDDGDHFATPLIVHFVLLSELVTPGSYYLVQDTRLDRTCRQQLAHSEFIKQGVAVDKRGKASGKADWIYCRRIIGESPWGRAYLPTHSPTYLRLTYLLTYLPTHHRLVRRPGTHLLT